MAHHAEDLALAYGHRWDRGKGKGYEKGRQDVIQDGYAKGYGKGHADGHARGYDEGFDDGHDWGYAACKRDIKSGYVVVKSDGEGGADGGDILFDF